MGDLNCKSSTGESETGLRNIILTNIVVGLSNFCTVFDLSVFLSSALASNNLEA